MLTVVRAPKFIDNKYSEDSFALFEDDRCVGHVMRTSKAPAGKPWFWTIFTHGPQGMVDRGYATSREQAMIAFKAAWAAVQKGTAVRSATVPAVNRSKGTP